MLHVALAFVLSVVDAFSCCDDAGSPSSCRVIVDVADSSVCDHAAEWAFCQIDGPLVIACEPVELYCCAETSRVGWLDACEAYMPGTRCGGVVVGKL